MNIEIAWLFGLVVKLIEWFKDNFNLDKAIEIGGNNYRYHHLGIKGIDDYSEQIPAVVKKRASKK